MDQSGAVRRSRPGVRLTWVNAAPARRAEAGASSNWKAAMAARIAPHLSLIALCCAMPLASAADGSSVEWDARLRYEHVDDAAFALAKSRSLTARGYGGRRIDQSLRAAGIGEEDGQEARELAATEAVEAALRFARKRRFGPYAEKAVDRPAREKALAAMVRAGHGFALANAILALEPGAEAYREMLAEKSR